jgi:hypothetical protein
MMCMNTQVYSTIWTHIVNSPKALEEIPSLYLEGTLYVDIFFRKKKRYHTYYLKMGWIFIAL